MARDFNQNRIANAVLGRKTLDKFGANFAINYGLDGFNIVDIQTSEAPDNIVEYFEGNDTYEVFGLPTNITKLCEYALASFPSITDLYLFTNSVIDIEDDLSYLTDLTTIYVPTDLLSAYQNAYANVPNILNKLGTIPVDYELTIPVYDNIGNVLNEQAINYFLSGLSQAQKDACTKLIISTDYIYNSVVNMYLNYDFDAIFENLNKNIWYGNTFVATSQLCSITNLGSEDPSDVVFTKSAYFPTESQAYEQVIKDGNYFAKFTKWYKKVVADQNGNVREMYISKIKIDNDYHLYECFIDENGNELDYILIGQYVSQNSVAESKPNTDQEVIRGSAYKQTAENGRTIAIALGTGYQLYDIHMYMLWRDLTMAYLETVNSGALTNYLGLYNIGINNFRCFVDGIYSQNVSTYKNWYISNKPSKYTGGESSSLVVYEDYNSLSYANPTLASGCIKELGYDSNHPTITMPKENISNSNYDTYYCDQCIMRGAYSNPLTVSCENNGNGFGIFYNLMYNSWTANCLMRLCYRPINE